MQAQMPAAGSQYFQPGYAYRHLFNPAFVPQTGYVGIPVLGDLNLTAASNLGLADFLYPLADGSLGTFMHPEVPAETFLKNIKKNNSLNVSLNTSILSAGWFWGRSFWNFDIQVKAGLRVGIPYGFFEFLKKEMSSNPSHYQIEDLMVGIQSYMEIGIGYARELSPELTVGGKFKFLVGLAQMEMRVDQMDIYLSDEVWRIRSDASLRVFGRLLHSELPADATFPAFSFGSISPSGYGAALDLGAEYRPSFLPGLRFSASLLDMGFLSYKQQDIQQYSAHGEVEFSGFEDVGMDMDVSEEVGALTDGLMQMFEFQEDHAEGNMSRLVTPTLNFGAEYGFWGNRFSVGLLNTTVFYSSRAESDLTLIGNIHPCRWFSASIAYSFFGGNRGIGWALNITPSHGLNLFIASNYTPLQLSPQFIPLKKAHANIQFGLTIPLGNNRRYTYDADPQDVNAFPYTFRRPEEHPNRYAPEEAGHDEEPLPEE